MERDYDQWNSKKKLVNSSEKRPMFKERDVWWCGLGANIGHEEDGKGVNFTRPVLIVKKFNQQIFLGLPLSTQVKESYFYHKVHFNGIEQCVLLSHMRLLDAKRLKDKMGGLYAHEFVQIKEKMRQILV